MTAKVYQNLAIPLLKKKLANLEVVDEWIAFRGMNDQYSPRVDIAVGPFSTTSGKNKIDSYNQILEINRINGFLKKAYEFHLENIQSKLKKGEKIYHFNTLVHKNQNARCFLAIEIENTSTRKHIMGSMVNAASLGRIGIGIAYNETAKKTFIRILNYMAFLKRIGKNTYDTTNFMILTKDQFQNLL